MLGARGTMGPGTSKEASEDRVIVDENRKRVSLMLKRYRYYFDGCVRVA